MPKPLRLTCWGLLVALSAMFRVPEREAASVGVNVTLTTQLDVGAIVPPVEHVVVPSVVTAKSPAVEKPLMVIGAVPTFAIVTL